MTYRLKLATEDLLKLEKDSRSGGWMLACFVNFATPLIMCARSPGALKELQERKAQQRDIATVRSLLTEERVRRAMQLSKTLTADLDSHEVTDGTTGVADLF